MNFPVWPIPFLGGSLLIAIIAIVHVYIAHFAVGGGLWLVLTERRAHKAGDAAALAYARGHAKFFILLTLVGGAITGVGIWFVIGLVQPSATSALIHAFVWGWAIEWVFFIAEISAAYVYYYGWDRMDPRKHEIVGWIYAVSAWASLAIINGILSFMLTPGRWLQTRSFVDGVLNPGYVPSLLLRTAAAFALAGLFGIATATRIKDEPLRERMLKWSARWVAPSLAFLPVGFFWYLAVIPSSSLDYLRGTPALQMVVTVGVAVSVLLFLFTVLGPMREPKRFGMSMAALFIVLGLFATGSTEWAREAVRKPYIINGYMYSTSIAPDQVQAVRSQGVLQVARWSRVQDASGDPIAAGKEVFELTCGSCHTLRGYNGLAPMVAGWDSDYMYTQFGRLDTLRGFMPPFPGTDAERKALVMYLRSEITRAMVWGEQ